LANKELENYIRSFPNIDSEIYKALFKAKEYYNNKSHYYNWKIKRLKQKENDYKKLLDHAKKKKINLTEPKLRNEISNSIRIIKLSIKEIDDKIINLSNQIEELTLDLDEENYIIEEIKNLERDRKINLRHLRKLQQDLYKEMRDNTYFKTVRTIEILEINLNEIPKNLCKLSKKKVKIHKKFLVLYRKAKEFEIIKRQIEKEILGVKQTTDKNIKLFYDLRNQGSKKAIQEQLRLYKDRAKAKELLEQKTNYIIKKKRTQKKYTKEKLRIALEKQKSGKRLDFYELKLILDHSKKRE